MALVLAMVHGPWKAAIENQSSDNWCHCQRLLLQDSYCSVGILTTLQSPTRAPPAVAPPAAAPQSGAGAGAGAGAAARAAGAGIAPMLKHSYFVRRAAPSATGGPAASSSSFSDCSCAWHAYQPVDGSHTILTTALLCTYEAWRTVCSCSFRGQICHGSACSCLRVTHMVVRIKCHTLAHRSPSRQGAPWRNCNLSAVIKHL
jgi:hypothetical protein